MMKWWAYIHSQDRVLHLKRWFPPQPGELCDLEYAKLEKENGNENILAIVPYPVVADTKEEAYNKVAKIFREMGYTGGQVRYTDPTTWPRTSDIMAKFNHLRRLKRFLDVEQVPCHDKYMAAEVGDTIEFIVEPHLLKKLMYEDESLAVEDEERRLGVSVEEIQAEEGKLKVRAKVIWIEEPEL